MDSLFAVNYLHFHSKFLVDMLAQVLGGIHTAVLASGASETEHQRGEATLDITAHMGISQLIHRVKEGEYLAVILKESDYRLVETSEFLIRLITSWIMSAAAVEDVSSAVARRVFGDSLAI